MSLAICLIVPALLVLWDAPGALRRSPWPAVAAATWSGYHLVRAAADNVRHPHEWDFLCFWLYGHVAAAHLNVYDPAAFAGFALPFAPSADFRSAVIDVGFPYPPPTMALFAPLTLVHGYSAELALWYLVGFAALAGAAWVLARVLVAADGWRGVVLIAALILALPASQMTVGDAQTNFLVLLLVALSFASRTSAVGAVWQTLAIWVKPYTAVLFLLDILSRAGRRLSVAVLLAAASLALATLGLGSAAVVTYVRANPAGREPSAAFVEVVNQSLLAVVLRLQHALPAHVSALHEPLYLAATAGLGVLTIAVCLRAGTRSALAFAAALLFGLIVYPGSLSSYGVVLILPLLIVWRERAAFVGGTAGVGLLAGAAMLLQSDVFERGIFANGLVWLACAYLAVRRPVVAAAAPAVGARVGGISSVEAIPS